MAADLVGAGFEQRRAVAALETGAGSRADRISRLLPASRENVPRRPEQAFGTFLPDHQ